MKDFDSWNEVKKKVDIYNSKKYHPKEIWWSFWGLNIGYEESGKDKQFKRPVLILKTLSHNTCIVVPLTTSKDSNRNRINIGLIEGKHAKIIISQLKVIDTRRLSTKICILDDKIFFKIRKAVKDLF
jgi:mRNA interferase MazF